MENPAVKNGLLMGLVVVVIQLVLYLVSTDLLMNTGIGFSFIILYVYFMYQAGVQERANLGGFMSWGEALKPTFLTYAIGSLIVALFTYCLYNMIDPSLIDVVKEKSIAAIEGMSGLIGEEAAEEAMERTREELENTNPFSLGQSAMSYVFGLIFGFIVAAIVSAVVKKSNPAMQV